MTVPRSIARAQVVIQHTFSATAAVWRKTSVSDNAGGSTDSYAAVATYACSFAPHQITPTEREATVSVIAVSAWVFRFAAGTDVRTTDRLVVGTRTFEVTS